MSKFKFDSQASRENAIGRVFTKSKEYQSQPKPRGVKCNLLIYKVYDECNEIVGRGSINSKDKVSAFVKLVHKTKVGYIETTYSEHPIPCHMVN